MGNLTIYRPGKSKDYRFLDGIIGQSFNISGTLIHCHKYIGPAYQGNTGDSTMNNNLNINETTIQDVLLLENRDRQYDPNIFDLKGNYTVNNLDFNLTQFGAFLSNGTIFINFHINQIIDRIGRKLMPGDVLEIVHKKEEVVLDPSVPYIPSFYVITDTSRGADGYSPTWLPHIWRVKAEPLADSQEYRQILETLTKKGDTLQDLISTYNEATEITDAVKKQGHKEVPTRNFNTDDLFIQTPGVPLTTDNLKQWQFNNPLTPPNSDIEAPKGTRFPSNPEPGDYFLRTDYNPPRMFQRKTSSWEAMNDVWRDREWSPAHRALEDQLVTDEITEISTDPADIFNARQPINDPIPPKINLPKKLNNMTPEEIEEENNE